MDGTPLVVMPDGVDCHERGRLGRRGLLLGALGVAAAGAAAGLVRFLSVSESRSEIAAGLYVVPQKQLPRPGDPPAYFAEGRFYLVNIRPREGGYTGPFRALPAAAHAGLLGLNDKCTHLHCRVPWRPNFVFDGQEGWFRCPCHSATYTKAGRLVFGPAIRSMDTVPLQRNRDGSVTVRFTEIRPGSPDDPQRVVPLL